MICIYHSRDLDGWCSGAIMKRKFPEATFIGWDYGEAVPYSDLPEGEEIMMADISFPIDDMKKIATNSHNQLTWIDHHISAIKEYEMYASQNSAFCTAVLNEDISACEGTWKHLFPEEDMPTAVHLLGIYDTVRRDEDLVSFDMTVVPFQYGMRSHCADYDQFEVGLLEPNNLIQTIIDEGEAILDYEKLINASTCEKLSFEKIFGGYRTICLNTGPCTPRTFESVYDERRHDLMMAFWYNGKTRHWNVSLYSSKKHIDCSELARSQGGGGHQYAAGFQIRYINNIVNAADSAPQYYKGVAKDEYDEMNNFNHELLLTLSKTYGDTIVLDVEQTLKGCSVRDKFEVVDDGVGEPSGHHHSLKEIRIEVTSNKETLSNTEERTEGNFYAKLEEGKWLKMPYYT